MNKALPACADDSHGAGGIHDADIRQRAFRTVFLVVFVPWLILLGSLIIVFARVPDPEDSWDADTYEIELETYTIWFLILGVPFAGASLALALVCVTWLVSWAHFQPY